MNRIIKARPLTREAFAPFGEVIEPEAAATTIEINGGRCMRFHDIARPEVTGENAHVLINLFHSVAAPLPLPLPMVERHPFGSQAFIPLEGKPFLVIVCEDNDGEPGEPQAFVTSGRQGINYRRNVWHAPLAPVGVAQDFLVVDRGGSGNNLVEHFFDAPYTVILAEGTGDA